MTDETACQYVSSRGLMKSCDVFPPHPSSSTRICYDYDWDSLAPGSIVYVNSSALPDFMARAWSRVRVPIVLVSGDCDETVPSDLFREEAVLRAFLDDDRLLAWFAQNAIPLSPKIHQLPIGLDYHTLSGNEKHTWGPKQTPVQQEQILNILKSRKSFFERNGTAHANFQFSMRTRYAQDRLEALTALDRALVSYEPAPTSRFVTWANQVTHRFVISPRGGGVDCHRTWEALCLGCIPIVTTSFLDPLFKDLPVLVVKSWASVTPDMLEGCAATYRDKGGVGIPPKLLLSYWVQKIRASATVVAAATTTAATTAPIGAHPATLPEGTAE